MFPNQRFIALGSVCLLLASWWGNGLPRLRWLAGVRAWPVSLGLRHCPDTYGWLQSRIFRNGRKSDGVDKLKVKITCSSHIGFASAKKILGNGAPYALSMINGILCCLAKSAKRVISLSVNTFPVGLVGRETQIAAISSVISRESKSTLYLNW